MKYRNMTVEEGAAYVIAQLEPVDIYYAASPERGDTRGFCALHDRMDANMLFPFVNDEDNPLDQIYMDFCNAIGEEVTRLLILDAVTEDERADWRYEVGNGDTVLGLLDWVKGRREQADLWRRANQHHEP